jgi:hypothetical protein
MAFRDTVILHSLARAQRFARMFVETLFLQKLTEDMADSDSTNSNGAKEPASTAEDTGVAPAPESATRHDVRLSEPRLLRSVLWLASGLAIAIVVGLLFAQVPTRFRLIGLLAIVQGCVVGWGLGRAALPLRMHSPQTGAFGGFAGGALSAVVASVLCWQAWAAPIKMPPQPRPDVALTAQMLAQMQKPDDGDQEQLKAYEETRQQMLKFLEQENAPPQIEFDDWLIHRSSALAANRNVARLIGLAELMLAGIAAGFFARRGVSAPFCSACQNWRRIIRSQIFPAPVPETLRLMISGPDQASIVAIAAELSACGCDARPAVNLNLETIEQRSQKQWSSADLSDEQFADLRRLMDEAQGMN